MPVDRGNLHERNVAKSTWGFIYSEELGQDDRLVYKVSFRWVRRKMSGEHQTSSRLRDKPPTEVLVTQSWRGFFIASNICTLCHRLSKGKTFHKGCFPLTIIFTTCRMEESFTYTLYTETISQNYHKAFAAHANQDLFGRHCSARVLITSRSHS